VRQPIYEIGCRICEMLIRMIRGEPLERRQVLLQPELVVRDSSRASQQL
jgi:LacI family transcriptional regulator